ncbi:MAG TPA: type II toxin-antitoxin system VapB family antitoxin [Thermoanaerobaculia bacterium]|nr:type II toxin-antitoxin system VapB family antitoxin [Thermoanaerobaculia bacterium]
MPLSIKNPRTEDLARQLAETTGETLTRAVTVAVEERLDRLTALGRRKLKRRRIEEQLAALRGLPDLDQRTPDQILGYDEQGLP